MTKMRDKENTWRPRGLEELNLMDDFLFQEMVSQEEVGEEFCRILLGTILGREIRKVRVVPQKSILGIDTDKHGIRLDAYIEEVPEECALEGAGMIDAEIVSDIYDVEPDKRYEKQTLPKRMRYYHGLIDTQFLDAGLNYAKLPNVVIITILPYDPFGKGRMVYTIQNRCLEDGAIPYEDGARKIFLYTRGTAGNPGQRLRDVLRYMEETTDDNVTNQSIANIHRLVQKVKRDRKAGIQYMKSWEREKIARDEGKIEGKVEGKIEVLLEILDEIGVISEELNIKIQQEEDEKTLSRWIKLACKVSDMAEFESEM